MKIRIGVLGLGGVGGYFGGLLAKAYADSKTVEIIFIARGETKNTIAANGLKIVTDQEEFTVFATIVSDNCEIIGVLDYLICATKTYDIEESLHSIHKCITSKTVILPLYNGVDATDRIGKLFPNNAVLQGCVYIVSMIIFPGVIRKFGPFEKLFFGSTTVSKSTLSELQSIFEKAAIESYLVDHIEETVWEKFIFISPLASATSFLNTNIAGILNVPSNKAIYVELLHEITSVAIAKGLAMPKDIISETIAKLEKSPQEATSSMHRDLIAGRKTEVASLSRYVLNEAKKFQVDVPTYQKIVNWLENN